MLLRGHLLVKQVEWSPENELQFSGSPEFRLFDVVADTSPAWSRVEGWSGDEGALSGPTASWRALYSSLAGEREWIWIGRG